MPTSEEVGPSPSGPEPEWWSRSMAVAVAVAFLVGGAVGGGVIAFWGSGSSGGGTSVPSPTGPSTGHPGGKARGGTGSAAGAAGAPVARSGVGAKAFAYRTRPGVLVVRARNGGRGPMRVVAVLGARTLLDQQVAPGNWAGLVPVSAGGARVTVRGDGSWRMVLEQPAPRSRGAARLPGWLAGTAPSVIPVRVPATIGPARVSLTAGSATGRVAVELWSYKVGAPKQLLLSASSGGAFSVRRPIPAGHYLLHVDAVGRWTLGISAG